MHTLTFQLGSYSLSFNLGLSFTSKYSLLSIPTSFEFGSYLWTHTHTHHTISHTHNSTHIPPPSSKHCDSALGEQSQIPPVSILLCLSCQPYSGSWESWALRRDHLELLPGVSVKWSEGHSCSSYKGWFYCFLHTWEIQAQWRSGSLALQALSELLSVNLAVSEHHKNDLVPPTLQILADMILTTSVTK